MASKENQKALEYVDDYCWRHRINDSYEAVRDDIRKLQQAIYDLELYKKAYKLSIKKINEGVEGINTCPKGRDCLYDDWIKERDCNKCWSDYLLTKARKELENER